MTSKVVLAKQPCPNCPSSDAYHLYADGSGYCFSCNNYTKGNDLEYTYEFLPYCGINKDTLKFYDVRTKIDKEGKPLSVGFRYPWGDVKVRWLDRKEFYWEKNDEATELKGPGLFGRDKFGAGSNDAITITEGEKDALSLNQVIRRPVVSVRSASSAMGDCSAEREWLSSFSRIYLCFDNDAAGREATRCVAKLFDFNKIYVVKLRRKDANEHLVAGEDVELLNTWLNAKKYKPDNIVSSLDEFKKILKETNVKGIPYPFQTLTEMTYGLRTGESVLITAPEGVGKTEFMHAIEHQLLKETQENVGAIYLEEPKKRHLQALAGLELRQPVHLPDCPCTEDQVASALEAVVQKDNRLHVYSHFGSDDPELVLDTIRYLVTSCGCSRIMFDHITMAISGLAGEDERRGLDHLSTRLEMMVKELDFGLIIVSHVNDLGQTRGSRYISKIADIRIDLKRDLLNPDALERNTTYLTVSKNRFCGRTGPAGRIVFDPFTYTYREETIDARHHSTKGEVANDNNRGVIERQAVA